MKNMFAYPSMDGQHDGITIFFFLWRCKYSVPSFLIIPAASISLNRKEIGGNNIRPHPVCFYFPSNPQLCASYYELVVEVNVIPLALFQLPCGQQAIGEQCIQLVCRVEVIGLARV